MQFFKFLALAPVAASLVAATSLPGLDRSVTNGQNLPISGLTNSLSSLNPLSNALARRNKKCNTDEIKKLHSLIKVKLDINVTIDIVAELCDKTWDQVDGITAGIEANVDVDFWAQVLIDLRLTLEASISVYSELQKKNNDCDWNQLRVHSKAIIQLYAKIQTVLTLYGALDAGIQVQLKGHLEAFSRAFSTYTELSAKIIIGIDVDIHLTIQAIICLLDTIRVSLNLDLNVALGGLLSIGSN